MPIPPDYLERVYAGVLGKIIGVYLGRPVEGWTFERIQAEYGEVTGYIHESRGRPLVVPDDDLTGTFTFLRALADRGNPRDLTPVQIGETWLNTIVEGRTALWWGGFGNSTEQTAYTRLKNGVAAPRSGSIALNGAVVAEQIGAQIFIDGWAMVAPGDPDLAADLARRAASVSHDGEAVHGAAALAAMEALAFVEPDLERLLDAATQAVPEGSVIRRLYDDLREWCHLEPHWQGARGRLEASFGYDKYGGNVHVVPNHGVIVLALLYGEGDFHRTIQIATNCGWDTDCNVGNVGCLMGIRGGLAALDGGPDWRGPVADRLFLPGAEGGRAITDALTVALEVANVGRALAGEPPLAPKGGARYHFGAPGAVQGFTVTVGEATLENVPVEGNERGLELRARLAPDRPVRIEAATFLPPEVPDAPEAPFGRNPGLGWGYTLLASPSLSPGQTVEATLTAAAGNAGPLEVRLVARHYTAADELRDLSGPARVLAPSEEVGLQWRMPNTGGLPIASIGLEIAAPEGLAGGEARVRLERLTWGGPPEVTLGHPSEPGDGVMWRRAWVNAAERVDRRAPEPYRVLQGRGWGLLTQGTRDWTDYALEAEVTLHAARAGGVAARAQGLRRHYALLLAEGGLVRLAKTCDGERALAETPFPWAFGHPYRLRLEARGPVLRALVDGELVLEASDDDHPLLGGGVALLVHEGWLSSGPVRVEPLDRG